MSSLNEDETALGKIKGEEEVFDESESEESSPNGWWSYTTSLAFSIKEKFPTQTKQAFDGITDVIQRSATALVAEFAQMEIEAEREARRWRRERGYYSEDEDLDFSKVTLPWEIAAIEDDILKQKILSISSDESTFSGPFNSDAKEKMQDDEKDPFDLASHIPIIHRLLQIDPNLAKSHAKFSGNKIKEDVFWHNYFYHCLKIRLDHHSKQTSEKKLTEIDTVIDMKRDTKIEFDAKIVKENDAKAEQLSNLLSKKDDEDIVNIPTPPISGRSFGDLVIVGADSCELEKIAAEIKKDKCSTDAT